MRAGDLTAATAAIQLGLNDPRARHDPEAKRPMASERSLDGEFHVVTDTAELLKAHREDAHAESPVTHTSQNGTFTCAAGTRDYRVYAPGARTSGSSPLILMLHGCTQSADDFARGTRMHQRAAAEGYVVVYPTQSRSGNPGGCWNWFRPTDQQRDGGELAILAGLVSEMTGRFDCDPDRVYVAGLSAGGAMSIALGLTYSDVFRAVGAHSGLAYRAAHDVPSALAAMRNGTPRGSREAESKLDFVPTIVFHGDSDPTVNVVNATQIVDDAARALATSRAADEGDSSESTTIAGIAGGRAYTTTRIRDRAGKTCVESWIVRGGGHAWFGGDPQGTYTDPKGPDATVEMLRFFRNAS